MQIKLLTRKEIASFLKLSASTWDRMVAAGKTPEPLRFSRNSIRWPEDEIMNWIKAGCPDRMTWNRIKQTS